MSQWLQGTVNQGTAGASPWLVTASAWPLPTGAATSALQTSGNSSLSSIKTNTDPLVTAGGGGYVRQDSTATIAKESGGNLAGLATHQTDGTQKTQIVDSAGNVISSAQDSNSKYHLGTTTIQSVCVDSNNASVANLAAGATFVGSPTTSLGIVGIQVVMKADQNCTATIEQSRGTTTGPGTGATTGTTTLTGTGTKFLTDFQVGDTITVNGETVRTVASVTSDTVLDVTVAFTNTASGKTYTFNAWDVRDSFKYYTTKNFGITVQAVGAYLRVRVKNDGASTTTFFRVDTTLCPIVEAVPRTLDEDGLFQTTIGKITGRMGRVRVGPMGELKTQGAIRLAGAVFIGTTLDTSFWSIGTPVGTGAASQTGGELTLTTGATADSSILVNSVRLGRYIAASPCFFRANLNVPAVSTTKGTNTRRWGAFDANDGYFFELTQAKSATSTVLGVVSRKATSDTKVSTGSFNGDWGATHSLDTGCHTYEIWWSNQNAYFFIDDILLHVITPSATPAVATPSLKIGFQTLNAGTEDAANTLVVRSGTLNRLGPLISQPTSYYQTGTVAAQVLKRGAGNLHGIAISNVANTAAITLWDGVAAATTTIYATGAMGNNAVPFFVDFKGLPFFTGLTLTIAGAAVNCTAIFE